MAKGKTKPKAAKRMPQRQVVVRQSAGLDQAAIRYRNLLLNPCTAPLAQGIAGDGQGGLVVRLETDFLVNTSATDVGAFIAFTPGTNTYEISSAPITSDTGTITLAASGAFSFASAGSVVASYRCVAACIQIMWPGTELNRSGVVALGQCNRGDLASTVTTANLRTLAANVERTPEGIVELKWTPTEQDLLYMESQSGDGSSTPLFYKHGTLFMSAAGIPVSTGLRVRLVGVYEWRPNTGYGLTTPPATYTSSNSVAQVLHSMEGLGNWAYHSAQSAGKAASSLYRGVRAVGQLTYGVGQAVRTGARYVPALMG